MLTFPELSPVLRALLLSWNGILFIVYIFNMIRCIQIRKSRTSVIAAAVLLLMDVCIFQICIAQNEQDVLEVYAGITMPVPVLVAVMLVLMIAASVSMYMTRKWSIKHITAASIKESFDSLPTGLCFYYENGLPQMVNARMESICRSLTGHSLQNAVSFVKELKTGHVEGCIESGENPIYRLSDGSVISFSVNSHISLLCSPAGIISRIFKVNERPGSDKILFELLASDVTDEYLLTETLREKEKQAGYINKRLKVLLKMTEYNVMERELLELKANLHDNLGKSLLLARRYLTAPDSVDKRELIALWDRNIRTLKNEQPEYWQEPYYMSRSQAMLLGVELMTNGELPVAEDLQTVINTAINVHVTNVMRHAEGTKAFINVSEENRWWNLTFTNDGKVPDAGIKETGGLGNLRKAVEKAGGTMKIRSTPVFEMNIRLPEV